MPVIPTAAQTDAWYALPFDERNKQTFDQYIGNTGGDAPAPKAMTSDFPGAATATVSQPGGGGQPEATTQQAPATDWSQFQLMGSSPVADAQTIAGMYQKYLGRMPSQSEVYYASGHPGGAQSLEQMIANSDEAKAYAAQGTARTKSLGPATTPQPLTGGGTSNTTTTDTTTPYAGSQSLLLNAVMQRLSQLQQPIDSTYNDLYAKQALARVDQLSGAPFTDQQSAALLAKNMEPLTQARDTAKQQAAQDLARRGFDPRSGVFQDRMKQIDQAYEKGVAGVTSNLNIQGITQAQSNAQQQLQILDSLVSMGRMSRQEADQRGQEILSASAIPFSTDLQTLTALNGASGGNDTASAIQSLVSLGALGNQTNQINNQNGSANAQTMATVLGYLLNNHSAFGF